MMPGLRRILLISALAGLSVVLVMDILRLLEDRRGMSAVSPTGSVGPGESAVLGAIASYQPPPESRFEEALARPLFDPDRRPPDEPPVSEAAAERPFGGTLTGIVVAGEARLAIVLFDDSAKPQRLGLGESYRDWRLDEIGTDRAVFVREGERVTLFLEYREEQSQ
jgi:hypothetical protein